MDSEEQRKKGAVIRTPCSCQDDQETVIASSGAASVRTKILAYLGQLKHGEWISSGQLVEDLQLRFPTAKNTLTALENAGVVEREVKISGRNMVAFFRLDIRFASALGEPYIPPDWSDAYGKHPHNL